MFIANGQGMTSGNPAAIPPDGSPKEEEEEEEEEGARSTVMEGSAMWCNRSNDGGEMGTAGVCNACGCKGKC